MKQFSKGISNSHKKQGASGFPDKNIGERVVKGLYSHMI
jgi:hypothetical protein